MATATIAAVVFKGVDGNTYLARKRTAGAAKAALTASPIRSFMETGVVSSAGDATNVSRAAAKDDQSITGNDQLGATRLPAMLFAKGWTSALEKILSSVTKTAALPETAKEKRVVR